MLTTMERLPSHSVKQTSKSQKYVYSMGVQIRKTKIKSIA